MDKYSEVRKPNEESVEIWVRTEVHNIADLEREKELLKRALDLPDDLISLVISYYSLYGYENIKENMSDRLAYIDDLLEN